MSTLYCAGTTMVGSLTQTQATVDMPDNTTAPAEIDTNPTGGDRYAQVLVYCSSEFHYTLATTTAQAATRIASDTTRRKLPAGHYVCGICGNTELIAIRSTGGSTITDGISYEYVESEIGEM